MTEFSVTWDYRCPFARNAHEHVVAGLQAGADWDVTFVPFSLTQVHVKEGDVDAWDDPTKADTLTALAAGIVVRDRFPDRFLAAHRALFIARHDLGEDIRDPEVIAEALSGADVDGRAVLAQVEAGWPLAQLRKEHTQAAERHHVWGVPTFIVGDQASFVRVMHRPDGDAGGAIRTVDRILDLLGWPDLNEFKHTSIPR